MIAEKELVSGLHSDGAKLLEDVKDHVGFGGWFDRIRFSLLTLGLRPLVWDPINKLFNKNHLSLWEQTHVRSRTINAQIEGQSVGVFISSPGRRPLSESLILFQVGLVYEPQLTLVPKKDGIHANLSEWRAGRGAPCIVSVGSPTPEELFRFRTAITVVMNSPER